MAEPNGLNPAFDRIYLPGGVGIHAGTAYTDALIQAEVGTGTTPSIYLSTATNTPSVWVLVATTWTRLTIN